MHHNNSIRILTGVFYLLLPVLKSSNILPGNSHPELAQAVAER